MRKVAVIVLVVMASVVLVASALAESATKEECIAKCKEAAQLIVEKGLDAALQEINQKDGKYVWKDTYVFIVDFNGTFVAHPSRPDHIGKNYLEWKTSDGKYPQKMSIDVAKTRGEGWVEYVQAKPEELKKPPEQRILSKKLTYIYRVPGKDMYVGAGVYE
jgi:signal transduction histidine kinase